MLARVPLGQFKRFTDSAVEPRLTDWEKVDGGEDRGQKTEDLQLMSHARVEGQGGHGILRRAASGAVTSDPL